ncbi:thioredoxin family protein [Natronincola ferrireducens]|uniref:Thioredoxin n=1 Tax=Natronincola ferrireducens TaxID=393762 RepID=A0A1G9IRK0_9FIRM|nr:thioredoxin family protein [Natronincola ferrireducens]SDL27762.1 Thioredoxin [Natronincola ferrireducens]
MNLHQLFELGVSFQEFLNKDQDINREKTLEIYENIFLTEEMVHKIQKIDTPIYVLAFAEIWCPDCMINVPALQKMKDINPKIEVAILPREGYEAYMSGYKVGGKVKIPTFVILDSQYEEKGVFIETPKIVKDIVAKGNQVEIIVAKRKYRKGEYIKDTIEEILNIIFRK